MRNTQQGSQKVDNPPSTRVEVVIRKFRITATDVLPAHTGVIFRWEYYPFPPNWFSPHTRGEPSFPRAHEGNPADVPDKNIGNILKLLFTHIIICVIMSL